MFFTKPPQIVITEPDIEAALAHLRSMPFAPESPVAWDRKEFLDSLMSDVAHAKSGDCIKVAPGIWAIIHYFGADMLRRSDEFDRRLQVFLVIRGWGTDPSKVTVLRDGAQSFRKGFT